MWINEQFIFEIFVTVKTLDIKIPKCPNAAKDTEFDFHVFPQNLYAVRAERAPRRCRSGVYNAIN